MLASIDRSRLVQRFGPEAERWCEELPELIESLATAWRLRVETLLPAGSNSVVLQAVSASGGACVLKLTPETAVAAQEAAALTVWASCRHVVSMLDCDLERGALLLEFVAPGQTLAASPDGWALDEIAPLLSELWQPRLQRRIDWLARAAADVDTDRVWAWSQAMAVIIAASMLARHDDDPVAEFLLRFAGEIS